MLRLLPDPEVITGSDIERRFKARGVQFKAPGALKRELYKQLGQSEMLEPISSVADMAHDMTDGFYLILQSSEWLLKYQYRGCEIKFDGEAFTPRYNEPEKEGFTPFDGDEAISFIEYCIEEGLDFTVLSDKPINKARLIEEAAKQD